MTERINGMFGEQLSLAGSELVTDQHTVSEDFDQPDAVCHAAPTPDDVQHMRRRRDDLRRDA
jgi:hypothetical protein